ncbi:MAG TPA: peptidoglycan-associated lipoprotein Pal [Vicinamibacterales bacterium]|nr:peptidoglycan-associated lipoprotein Pal [Vicinamibacterales bacterium]
MQIRRAARTAAMVGVSFVVLMLAACGGKQPPVARPTPPPPPAPVTAPAAKPPAPPEPVVEQPPVVPPEPIQEDTLSSSSLDTLNRNSPFKDVFYEFDSAELSADGRAALQADVELLKKYPTWKITIEGHCDERGTAEYNLALGERRAGTVEAYLVSLGIAADRMRTVSYGKEFPFDPGHDEAAWAKNRRAHFVLTSK